MITKNATPLPAPSRAASRLEGLIRVCCPLLAMIAAPVSAQGAEAGSWPVLNQWVLVTPLPILILQVMGLVGVLSALVFCSYLWLVPENDTLCVEESESSETLARKVIKLPIAQPSAFGAEKEAA